MPKIFKVEINETGYYTSDSIWYTTDGLSEVIADNEEEAVQIAKDYLIDSANSLGNDVDQAEKEFSEWAWRVAEVKYEDGMLLPYEWKNI